MADLPELRFGRKFLELNSGRLGQTLLPVAVNSSDLRHIVVAHTGHSSQLFPVTDRRNAQFLATIQIGLNVSHTDAGSLENDKIGFL